MGFCYLSIVSSLLARGCTHPSQLSRSQGPFCPLHPITSHWTYELSEQPQASKDHAFPLERGIECEPQGVRSQESPVWQYHVQVLYMTLTHISDGIAGCHVLAASPHSLLVPASPTRLLLDTSSPSRSFPRPRSEKPAVFKRKHLAPVFKLLICD